jgi:hypothetical protein
MLPNLNELTISHESVYVIDGIFEVFVIVGTRARSDRPSIRLALEFAKVGCHSLRYVRLIYPYPVNCRAYLKMLPITGRSRLLFMLWFYLVNFP